MTRTPRPPRSAFALAALLAATSVPLSATQAQEVVQQLPNPAQEDLADAMRRLGSNPESVPALVAAGRASLELGDADAAQGFFNRALSIAPEDGRVLSGLALIAVRQGDAVTAVRLFDDAEAAGESLAPYAADRGLAYDLTGQNAQAQRYYREALSRGETAETVRRLALSYAIAGDADASETTLLPLLQRQDRAAFRTRAFVLAILGQGEEAVSIASTMLPQRLANQMEPFLRDMDRLTAAQQAAAANLGRFPTPAQIGRDTPEIAALSRVASQNAPPRSQARAADRLVPGGEPLGPAARSATPSAPASGELPARQAAVQPVAPPPATAAAPAQRRLADASDARSQPASDTRTRGFQSRPVQQARELPGIRESVRGTVTVQPAEEDPAPAGLALPTPSASPAPSPALSASDPATAVDSSGELPAIDPSAASREATVVASLADEPATRNERRDARPSFSISERGEDSAEEAERVDLASAFADFDLAASPASSSARAGAVDITAIQPRREAPPSAAAPAPPVSPARHWVQVATGQDVDAFRFDWRRIVRASDGLLDNYDAFTAPWGQTNRLLTGPFASAADANAFVRELGEAGVDAFRFSSSAGEEISPLD
ncbi:tetratricopeptide repeat protein [Aurantiacibacter spongiae]|nr:tetratricopeptide repeat protein [Aurantiacibacter spongiae]